MQAGAGLQIPELLLLVVHVAWDDAEKPFAQPGVHVSETDPAAQPVVSMLVVATAAQ